MTATIQRAIAQSVTIDFHSNYEFHKRTVTPLMNPFVDVGGLTEFIFTIFWFLHIFFGKPFRELNLGLSYSQLLDKVNGAE